MRTAGEGKSEEDLAADMNFLFNLWMDIRQKAEKRPAPLLLHHDLDIVERTLRDQFTEDFKAIWVDNEELYENVLRFVQRFQPALVTRVKLYTRPEPIFDAFNITAELEKALRPKVWLKSGGHIVINQTEALVAVDVNTGKYVGRSNRLEDTIVKTNTEAVKEIVRQIRLRDLGGIIVVDFIDMDERKNRQKVMQVLEDAMRVRSRAVQNFAVQRFRIGGHHAQARETKPGAGSLHAVPALRRRGLRQERADHRERNPAGGAQNRRRHRRQGRHAARPSRRREVPQIESEQVSRRDRGSAAPARAGESRSVAASREVRSGLRPNQRVNILTLEVGGFMSAYAHPEVLVTTDWVASHAKDANVRVVEVDVDTKAYDEGHVPGAIAWAWNTQLCDTVLRDILRKRQFESFDDPVRHRQRHDRGLYGDNNNWFAAWAFWQMKIYGHEDVRLMNGGRKKWLAEGRDLDTRRPSPVPRDAVPGHGPGLSLRAFLPQVQQAQKAASAVMIDVRSPQEFTGEILAPPGLPETCQRGGHIPGARSVPWGKACNDDGTFKSLDELRALYGAEGVSAVRSPSSPIAASASAPAIPGSC